MDHNNEAEVPEEQFDAAEQQIEQDDGVEIVDVEEEGMSDAVEAAIGKPVEERDEEPAPEKEPEKAEGEQKLEAGEEPDKEDFKLEGEVSDKTRKTFDRLIGRLKERDSEFETLNTRYEGLRETLTSTGAEPEQLAKLLEYPRLLSNGNYEAALSALDKERENLARLMGKPVDGVDLLGDFPDLREKVEYGDLSEDAALELANHRRREMAQRQFAESQQRQTHERQFNYQQQLDVARQQLNAVDAALKNMDPQYSQKLEQLAPVIQRIRDTLPPSQWASEFQKAYSETKVARHRRQNQPLSGGGMANTGSGIPQTFEDAIAAGLARAQEG